MGRLFEQEEQLLQQPVQSDISVLKESIIFITPPQPNAAKFLLNKYKIKLVAKRHSDGYVSRKKFDFTYVPHDFSKEFPACFAAWIQTMCKANWSQFPTAITFRGKR